MEMFNRNIEGYEDKVLEKWSNLGFLKGLNGDIKLKTALGFQHLANLLTLDNSNYDMGYIDVRKYSPYCDVVAFPSIRKLFDVRPDLEYSTELINGFLDNLSEYLKVNDCEEGFKFDTSNPDANEDAEVQMLIDFIDEYYGQ